MDPEPDVIRQDIEETRESLAKKVETLEEQVKDTISNVKDTVEDTIENVKEKVQDTVQSVTATVEDTVSTVKRTFDIPYQVERHPWTMAGCSLLAGMAVGYLVSGRRGSASGYGFGHGPARSDYPPSHQPAASSFQPAASSYQPAAPAAPAAPQGPGMLTRMLAPFESEIDKVKEVAIGALLGMLRDTIKRSLPPNLAANVDDIMNSATRKAGGQPVQGPVLPEESHTGSAGGMSGGGRTTGFNH